MTTRPLDARDAQILALLQQVVSRGEHLGAWKPADVVRVAEERLPHAHVLRRVWQAERRRANRLQRELDELDVLGRLGLPEPKTARPRRRGNAA